MYSLFFLINDLISVAVGIILSFFSLIISKISVKNLSLKLSSAFSGILIFVKKIFLYCKEYSTLASVLSIDTSN